MKLSAELTPVLLDSWYPDDSKVHVSKIDQTPNQEFNYNAIGYIRNNIASLMSIQNESAFSLAYSRLQELPNSSNLISDLSDTENLKLILPKTYQDPVEFSRFIDYVERVNRDKLEEFVENNPVSIEKENVNTEGS